MTKEWGMGFILSGIHVITGRRVRRRRKGEWQQTRQRYDESPTLKFTRLGLVCWVTVIYFAPWEEEKNVGSNSPRAFLVLFFFRGHLPQTSTRSKQYLPVIFATIFMKVGVVNYWRFNGIKTPSVKARTKVLASFEAAMNSPNLPWHVNITSLKYGSRFGEVPCFRQVEQFNSEM